MKERQRWRGEEDALLRAYVKQYGPREWHLVSERMHHPLNRDAKSCLERWKNYLKPGIKKGSLTQEEQSLVIHLQAKHGNKWKKIAAEVPGRTAKRLGKWWEVFKDKQQREHKESHKPHLDPINESKYDHLLETFAEKLVNPVTMPPVPNGGAGFLHTTEQSPLPAVQSSLPPWLASSSASSPSVTLSLSPLTVPPTPPPPSLIPWLQTSDNTATHGLLQSFGGIGALVGDGNGNMLVPDLIECCRELEEGHRAWSAHRKEAAWRLKRVELQLEVEKASRKREKIEDIEAKVNALREEQKVTIERIEAEYREQLAGLRREAELKEQKLAEQWAAKHLRLTKFIEQIGCRSVASSDAPNAR